MRWAVCVLFLCCFAARILNAADPPSVTPKPKKIEMRTGSWTWTPETTILASEKAKPWLDPMLAGFASRLGRAPEVNDGAKAVRIGLYDDAPYLKDLRPSEPRAESYVLEIDPSGVRLAAADGNGILYGLGTLLQLLPEKGGAMPCLRIEDAPAVSWRGIHTFPPSTQGVDAFKRFVDRVLVPLRFNVLVMEVNYDFPYTTHPEVRSGGARPREFYVDLADFLKARGIRPIPQFNCLGHQSWAKNTLPLLVKHPEFDETPWLAKDNPGIYCRSWCPRHPEVNPFVCDLLGELIDAFKPEALHVGMDEVFILGDEKCPRCAKVPKDELFAGAVSDLEKYLTSKKVGMLLWSDRLLDASKTPYGKWEASQNATAPAIDRISKQIICCDWHYGKHSAYPSIPYFQDKGFGVLACGWKEPDAARTFYRYALANQKGKFLGFLATTWMGADPIVRAALENQGNKDALGVAACVRLAGEMGWTGE